MDFVQTMIVIMGGAAIWLLGRRNPREMRWGYVVGLASQPFWLWATIEANQPGMFLLSLFYCWAWTVGIVNHWRTK
jgi:hypothetical protein